MPTLDHIIARVPLLLRYLLAALALCGLILAMILPRAAILRNGQEVRLEWIWLFQFPSCSPCTCPAAKRSSVYKSPPMTGTAAYPTRIPPIENTQT